MINSFKKQVKGFTLMETLVAVLLLSVAIAGPLTIVSKGIQETTLAKDQITAYNLAQDAVEYVRFVRDTNRLSGGNWLTGAGGNASYIKDLTPCTSAAGNASCYIDSLQNTVTSCPSNVCPVINWDATNNYFSYTSGSGSIFTRIITLTTPVGTNADEAYLTVKVTWCDQPSVCSVTPRAITVREDIFNWQ